MESSGGGGTNLLGTYTTLFRLIGADMNSIADQPFVQATKFTKFIPIMVVVTNASGPITTAAGGIYTAASKGGIALVSAAQAWTGLTSTTKAVLPSVTAAAQAILTGNLYLSLTTPMGSAATADFYVMGIPG